MQTQFKQPETWIKVLSKGVITIPKDIREQLGLKEGDVARAKVVGDKLVIESRKSTQYEELRLYSKEQIDKFVKEDQLPEPLARKVAKRWSDKKNKHRVYNLSSR
ncbi:MAG: AbrB/MazE/SpoVT family DNA-binding domain-containing protein [Candidatus Levybacteria bacterium]|nr:AbrB/MazE/SpoVT family DNA-binding domain-containing protein [Candidatus Levybacteria bacterium]